MLVIKRTFGVMVRCKSTVTTKYLVGVADALQLQLLSRWLLEWLLAIKFMVARVIKCTFMFCL